MLKTLQYQGTPEGALFLVLALAGIVGIPALYLGIRYAKHAKFQMAKQMLLSGRLKRVIGAEASFADFRRRLERAADIDEFWTLLRAGSAELGFKGVRMGIDGTVFEEAYVDSERLWQLRIPLEEGRYVNFCREFDSRDPVLLSAFANSIERSLRQWLAARAPETLHKPVASQSHFAASASAEGAQQ